MRRMRHLAFIGLALMATSTAYIGDRPPEELSGLWSAGPAACEAGIGVLFDSDEIAAIYSRRRDPLFLNPRYERQDQGENFRVRIVYDLPRLPGGSGSAAYGVLVLERGNGGDLIPATHNLIDRRTGSARLQIEGDPAMDIMQLRPCGETDWIGGLRGR